MPRGFCSKCGQLVAITARGWAPGRTRQLWFPEMHPGKGGAMCDGEKLEAGNPPADTEPN